jgi:hypothetical protein
MKTSIFIVTYRRDFTYLKYCLRSIEKFCLAFHEVVILVPTEDLDELKAIVSELPGTSGIPFRCIGAEEWPGAGMTFHMCQICRADEWCPDADFIMHLDSDCIFYSFVSPSTFIINGKPVLQYEPFESIAARHQGVMVWKRVTELCLPFEVEHEAMRQHCETFGRALYGKTRALVEQKTGVRFDDYVRSCSNQYPQGFCEFVTLGNVAIKHFPFDYHLANRALQKNPDLGLFPLHQFWSHGSIDAPQHIWWNGKEEMIVPMEKIKELGLV